MVSKFVPTRLASGRDVYMDDDELKLLVRSHKKRKKRKKEVSSSEEEQNSTLDQIGQSLCTEMKKARSEQILEKS